jgi:hypothetical protein
MAETRSEFGVATGRELARGTLRLPDAIGHLQLESRQIRLAAARHYAFSAPEAEISGAPADRTARSWTRSAHKSTSSAPSTYPRMSGARSPAGRTTLAAQPPAPTPPRESSRAKVATVGDFRPCSYADNVGREVRPPARNPTPPNGTEIPADGFSLGALVARPATRFVSIRPTRAVQLTPYVARRA